MIRKSPIFLFSFVIFLAVTNVSGQPPTVDLAAGESLVVTCAGQELLLASTGATTAELDCVPAPTATPTSTATSTPVPTATATLTPTPAGTEQPPPGTRPFVVDFTGMDPAAPSPYLSDSRLSVAPHYRNAANWFALPAQTANHGADCSPPPAGHQLGGLPMEASVYVCRQHIMSSLKASGYGMTALTPAALLDWSAGEAVFRFDMSSMRVSGRDWIDVWLSPYQYNLVSPHEGIGADLNGPPFDSIRIQMQIANSGTGQAQTFFKANVFDNFAEGPTLMVSNTPLMGLLPDLSRTRRETFELRVSTTHLSFCLPDYGHCWVDNSIDIDWTAAVVQVSHHSYNPDKACNDCGNLTWHFDNFTLDPWLPLAIVPATPFSGTAAQPGGPFTLAEPAPAGAHVRAAISGVGVEVRFDGGAWQAATLQLQGGDTAKFRSYWHPVPAGTTLMEFRGTPSGQGFLARAVEVWAVED